MTDLVAPGVVNTMPEATLRAVADHGQIPADSVRGHYQDARQVLSELAAAGVDYDDVTAGLEQHGLELFDATNWPPSCANRAIDNSAIHDRAIHDRAIQTVLFRQERGR